MSNKVLWNYQKKCQNNFSSINKINRSFKTNALYARLKPTRNVAAAKIHIIALNCVRKKTTENTRKNANKIRTVFN